MKFTIGAFFGNGVVIRRNEARTLFIRKLFRKRWLQSSNNGGCRVFVEFGANRRERVVEIGEGAQTLVRRNVNGAIGGQRSAVLHGKGNGGF